jgi:alkanesulfonate monooxygenase SsuD/methylene tetrahydromethanopterin reductase-like flavin-dependent oxidoreductase (luciferase family)
MRLSLFSVLDHYPDRSRSVAQLYAGLARQAGLGDALGYDTFFVAEHHFHPYGVAPDPAVLLAALAQRTRRIRLGTAIATLPFRDVVATAESYAMLDVLSEGRLVLGVGSGYLAHEFAGFGIDPAEKRGRFDEALPVLRRLLAGERVAHEGTFLRVREVALNVLPLQPRVPIYVAVLRREAAFHVGRAGELMMSVPYASVGDLDEVGALVADYRRGRREAGLDRGEVVLAFHTHVAESDAAARDAAAAAFDRYVETRLYARRVTYDEVAARGLCLFGSVATVEERLRALAALGVDHVMALQDFGLLPADAVARSMTLLMGKAAPRLLPAR